MFAANVVARNRCSKQQMSRTNPSHEPFYATTTKTEAVLATDNKFNGIREILNLRKGEKKEIYHSGLLSFYLFFSRGSKIMTTGPGQTKPILKVFDDNALVCYQKRIH